MKISEISKLLDAELLAGEEHLDSDEEDKLQYCLEENSGVAWLPVDILPQLTNEWQMDPIYAKLLKRAREWI